MKTYYFLIQDKKQGMKSKTETMFPKIFMKARSIFDAIYGQHFPISICSMHLHSVITLIIYFFKYILLFLSVVQSAFLDLNSNCLHITKRTHTTHTNKSGTKSTDCITELCIATLWFVDYCFESSSLTSCPLPP